MNMQITDTIRYIGVDDTDLDLFEGQYIVPEGVSYNSYIIDDEQPCIMDTVDERKSEEWLAKIDIVPTYLVMLHCEPDHSGNAAHLLAQFPGMTLVCSAKALQFFTQLFPGMDLDGRVKIVKEGDELCLGKHTLHFIAAPMVHWPEVMMAYESTDKVLFAADGFGKFGALCNETDDWACEARRYYFNICGKYGAQVQSVLKKAANLDIRHICPLHGPVLSDNLGYYVGLYDTWSSYRPETQGVFIAHCSLHGNTSQAAELLAEELRALGVKVALNDLTRDDYAEGIEDAFRYPVMVLCSPTYDGGIMPVMANFIHLLAAKTYQKRTVALVENGTWAPQAGKLMRAELEKMKEVEVLEPVVSLRSSVSAENKAAIKSLAQVLSEKIK